MSVETEEILTKVKRIKNVAKDGELTQKAVRFMTHQEQDAKKDDLQFVESILSPHNVLPNHTMITQDARKNLVNYSRFLKKDLAENVAPDKLPGEAKDALMRRRDFLVEKIREGMPPNEIMKRNPPGAVSQHMKWMAATKDYQLEYKNVQRALEPDDNSEDLANIEMLRPSMAGPAGDAATFMADAQIQGYFAQSALAKANWPLGEPKMDTALAQAERRELEELRAEKARREEEHKERQRKYGTSAEALARQAKKSEETSKRMKEFWAKKKAKITPEVQNDQAQQTETYGD
jgi:hypothetical protein